MFKKIITFCLKFILITFLVLVLLGGLAIWGAGFFLPKCIEHVFNDSTSFKMDIDSSKIKLWKGFVSLEDIAITNPSRFENQNLALVHKIKVDVDPKFKFFFDRDMDDLKIKEIVLDIENIYWVKNSDGEVNVVTLGKELYKEWGSGKDEKAKPAEKAVKPESGEAKKPAKAKAKMPLIRELKVRIGTVVYEDLSNPEAPISKTIKIDYERTFENVTDLQQVLMMIYMDLQNLGVNFFVQELLNTLLNPQNLLKTLGVPADQLLNAPKESIKELKKNLKNNFKDALDGFKNL